MLLKQQSGLAALLITVLINAITPASSHPFDRHPVRFLILSDISRGVSGLESLPHKLADLYQSVYVNYGGNVYALAMTCANENVNVIVEQQRADPVNFKRHLDAKFGQAVAFSRTYSSSRTYNNINTGLRVVYWYVDENRQSITLTDTGFNDVVVITMGVMKSQPDTSSGVEETIRLVDMIALNNTHVFLVDMTDGANLGAMKQFELLQRRNPRIRYLMAEDWQQLAAEINSLY